MREIIARGGSYQNASIQRKMRQDQLSPLAMTAYRSRASFKSFRCTYAIDVQLEREAADDAHEHAALREDEELALTIHAGGELDQVRNTGASSML